MFVAMKSRNDVIQSKFLFRNNVNVVVYLFVKQ
jgi:hypothetical protein